MKSFHKYLIGLLMILNVLLVHSCSSNDNLTIEGAIQKLNYSNSILGYEEHLLHQTVQQKIKRGATQYHPLVHQRQLICQLQLKVENHIDRLIKQTTYNKKTGQQLLHTLGQVRQKYLHNILALWQKGGIKGTIFSDSQKRLSQERYLICLMAPIDLLVRDSQLILNHFDTNHSEVIQYYFQISKNALDLVTFSLIQYLYRQIGFMCDFYPLHIQIQWNTPNYLYQNKPIAPTIRLQKKVLNKDFTIQSDNILISPYPTWFNYQTLPTSIGQKQDTIQIDFLIPRLQDTIQHQVTKIIHYEVIP